jgi:flagellar protein FlbD
MIMVTRFDGTRLAVNVQLIEFVEATPDTVLSMTTGRKLIVRETPEQVVDAVVAFKRRVLGGLQMMDEE